MAKYTDDEGPHLSSSMLYKIERIVEKLYGGPHVERDEVEYVVRYKAPGDIRMPLCVENPENGVKLWLDPYYAAYQVPGKPLIYAAATLHHVIEEENSYTSASIERRHHVLLPDDIRRWFDRIKREMPPDGIWLNARMYGGEIDAPSI